MHYRKTDHVQHNSADKNSKPTENYSNLFLLKLDKAQRSHPSELKILHSVWDFPGTNDCSCFPAVLPVGWAWATWSRGLTVLRLLHDRTAHSSEMVHVSVMFTEGDQGKETRLSLANVFPGLHSCQGSQKANGRHMWPDVKGHALFPKTHRHTYTHILRTPSEAKCSPAGLLPPTRVVLWA